MRLRLFLSICLAGSIQSATAQEAIRIVVTNYDDVWEFRLDSIDRKIELVASTRKNAGEKWPTALPAVMAEQRQHRELHQSATKELQHVPASAKWAEFSPDCQFVVIGFENPNIEVRHSLSYGYGKPWSQLGELKLQGHNSISDTAWLPGSHTLAVLEAEERYSMSPLGIFAALSGHPVPITTFYLTTIDVVSGDMHRSTLLPSVPEASGVVYGPQSSCRQP